MVNFLNSFMSYMVVLLVIVVIAGVAITVGIFCAKLKNNHKNKKQAVTATAKENTGHEKA